MMSGRNQQHRNRPSVAPRCMLQRGVRYWMPEQYFAAVGGNSAWQEGFFIWLQVVYNFLHIYIHIYISTRHSRIFASCIVFQRRLRWRYSYFHLDAQWEEKIWFNEPEQPYMIFLHLDLSSVMIFTLRSVLLVEYKCMQVHNSILVVTRANFVLHVPHARSHSVRWLALQHAEGYRSRYSQECYSSQETPGFSSPLSHIAVCMFVCVCVCVCVCSCHNREASGAVCQLIARKEPCQFIAATERA